MKGCGEVKGTVPLQGVHKFAGETGCASCAGSTAGFAPWAQAAGRPMARKRWGSLRESLALEQWVRFVGKDVSRTKGSEGGRRQRKPGFRGFWLWA